MAKSRPLIIVRHAHRETDDGRQKNNGLSLKGVSQAKSVSQYIHKNYPDQKWSIGSSPKLRCIETLLPFVEGQSQKIDIYPWLDEGGALDSKIEKFLNWVNRNCDHGIVVCSHGDWIPTCTQLIIGEAVELKKGGLIEFDQTSGEIHLLRIVQRP